MDQQDQKILIFAASGLRDKLSHYPDQEIAAPSGRMGLNALVQDVVQYLRERGVDDSGAWDCEVTKDIPVSTAPRSPWVASGLPESVWRSIMLAVQALTEASLALERKGDEHTRGFVRSALIALNGTLVTREFARSDFADLNGEPTAGDAGGNREEYPTPRSGG